MAGNTDAMIPQSHRTLAHRTPAQNPLILLTRPREQSLRFAGQITEAFGPWDILISPVLAIQPLAVSPLEGSFSDLILTSLNGADQAGGLGFPLPRHAFCVGERTAHAARQAGFTATTVGSDAESLIAALLRMRPAGRLLHLHGVETRGAVADRLTEGGIPTLSLAIYDQVARPLTDDARRALDGARPVILPVFSPRTARIIAEQGPFTAPLQVVALSAAVAAALRPLSPDRLEIAQSPDAAGMLDAMGGILRHPRP